MAEHTITIASDGSGAGVGYSENLVHGQIEAVRVVYGGTPDAGTDVTVSENVGLGRTILSRANTGTDGTFHPRILVQDTAGTDIEAQYEPIYVWHSQIKVVVAGAVISTAAAVTVKIVTRD